MTPRLSVALLCVLTVIQTLWLLMIARQNSPYLMAVIVVAVVVLAGSAMRRRPSAKRSIGTGLLGAGAGYMAALLAALISECTLRGAACLSRDFSANLYFFPTASFAWIYGAIAFLLLARLHRQ